MQTIIAEGGKPPSADKAGEKGVIRAMSEE
jgi:hypothetical protein